MAKLLRCPTCDRPIEWSEAFPFRPFCSERCRLIDLGEWLSEERRIPGGPAEQAPREEPQADSEH